MRYIAIFEDIADGSAIRADLTEAHQAFLRQHKGKLRLAGAVREEHGGRPVGGAWVFDTDTREEADAIVRADPFFAAGLRATYKLLAWGTAPGYEDVVL
ncbi:hypothetical protein VE25_20475 [Devosia geojensis]|uniref:YCII-related domain-containing protein n=1 Tax=Devosia geojensis TaxID=443610 RepID=A0A0F5FDC7_9HYPH|nr:YciI family protein [Devosia geojensis]KKB06856.1 hypothetical protein VE25_20475 [Devosia geojensis]